MEKIKSFLLNSNIALIAFVAFTTRLVILGASFSDALALLAYTGLFAYDKWLKSSALVSADAKFKQAVATDLENIKSAISAVKLGQATWGSQVRKVNNGSFGQ